MNITRQVELLKNQLRKHRGLYTLYQMWFEKRCSMNPTQLHGLTYYGDPVNLKTIWEEQEIKLVNKLIPEVDYMINIGANIGYYSCFVASKGIRSIAVEPLRRNLKYLYQNIEINNLEDLIEVYPLALSNKTGLCHIYGRGGLASLIKGWYGQPINQYEVVPVTTFDKLFSTRFFGKRLLIIMDVEGNEFSILQESQNYLKMNPKPIWLMEIAIYPLINNKQTLNKDVFATFSYLYSNGYRAWWISDTLMEISKNHLDEFVSTHRERTLNFIFMDVDVSDSIGK